MRAGDEGVRVAHGDQGGGYCLVVEGGRLAVAYNAYGDVTRLDAGPLAPGEHVIELRSSPRPGFRCDVAVRVDGRGVAAATGLRLLVAFAPFSGISVGVDRGGPVDWALHERHGAYPFSGALHRVRLRPRRPRRLRPELLAQLALESELAYD